MDKFEKFINALKDFQISVATCSKCGVPLICNNDLSCKCPKCGAYFPPPEGDEKLKQELIEKYGKK